ncbi:MAG: cobyrinate a,c-diamide synthase [Papillibacter sp.]|nr:cobyrinate a,c-diamide synthase [Papillibacter sp.]
MSINRLMITAPNSGGGKTTLTCAILRALCLRGLKPASFKCGPDYIDPMFHEKVIGAKSTNLDLFFAGEEGLRQLLYRNSINSDVSVIEGAMGFYDGIGMTDEASASSIARATGTPAVLVADGKAQALSIAALISGFVSFRGGTSIKGVIFNRISPKLYEDMKSLVEKECGVRVYGYMPELKDCVIESRHLGLVTADEIEDIKEKLISLAKAAEESVDIDGLLELASKAPPLEVKPYTPEAITKARPKIAVARDRAFCFYYSDTLRLFEELGAEIAYFSPLSDIKLPEGCAGLYIGGGYPELYARQLSENKAMLKEVNDAVRGGMPTIAECGGFMYLHSEMEGRDGSFYKMAGVLPYKAYRTKKLQRFGYINVQAKEDSLLLSKGESIPAHEFHYWDSSDPGSGLRALRPRSDKSWDCAHVSKTMYAGYPHLYLFGNPGAAGKFVKACEIYKEKG